MSEEAKSESEFPIGLDEFARTHMPRRNVELMGGFIYHARQSGWVSMPYGEWVLRYEQFGTQPAGGE